MGKTKVCIHCKKNLPVEKFILNRRTKSKNDEEYRSPRCRECAKLPLPSRNCVVCGKKYVPHKNQNKSKYCSTLCSTKFFSDKGKEERKTNIEKRKKKKEKERQKNLKENKTIALKYKNFPKTQKEAKKNKAKFYFTGIKCRNGHLDVRYTNNRICKTCDENWKKEDYEKGKKDGRVEKRIKKRQEKLKVLRQDPEFDKEFRKKSYSATKKWAQANPEKVNKNIRRKRGEDPYFNIVGRIRTRINFVLKRAGTARSETCIHYTGCEIEFLVTHISNLFKDGMNWDNKGSWEIDHIRPCSSFDLTEEDQCLTCFNWRNLRPIDAGENSRKKDKYNKKDELKWKEHMIKTEFMGDLFLIYEEDNSSVFDWMDLI